MGQESDRVIVFGHHMVQSYYSSSKLGIISLFPTIVQSHLVSGSAMLFTQCTFLES